MIGRRSISSKSLCVALCVHCVSFGARNTTFKEGMSAFGWPTFSHPRQVTCGSFLSLFLFFLLFLFASDIIIWWWLLPAHLSCKANRPCLTWISFFQFFSFSKERNNIIGVNVVLCAGSWVNFNDSIHHISADWPISQCSVLLLTDYRSTATEDANSSRTFNSIRLKRLKLHNDER